MTTFRHNSFRFQDTRLTDDDVLNILEHSQDRAAAELTFSHHMLGIAIGRGLIEAPAELHPVFSTPELEVAE